MNPSEPFLRAIRASTTAGGAFISAASHLLAKPEWGSSKETFELWSDYQREFKRLDMTVRPEQTSIDGAMAQAVSWTMHAQALSLHQRLVARTRIQLLACQLGHQPPSSWSQSGFQDWRLFDSGHEDATE